MDYGWLSVANRYSKNPSMWFTILLFVSAGVDGCIPTYNPDFGGDGFAVPTTQPVATVPVSTVPVPEEVTTEAAQPPEEVTTEAPQPMTRDPETTAPANPTTTIVTTTTSTTTTTTTTTEVPCLENWTLNPATNFYYYAAPIAGRDWQESESFCNMCAGGHLASIHDAAEYDYISGLVTQHPDYMGGMAVFLLGGSTMNGVWSWSDGSLFDYTRWAVAAVPLNPDQACMTMTIESPNTARLGWAYYNCGVMNDGFMVCKAPA